MRAEAVMDTNYVDVMILQSFAISLGKTRISACEILTIHSLNLYRKRAEVGFSLLSVNVCFPLSLSLSFYLSSTIFLCVHLSLNLFLSLSGKRRHGDILVGGEAVREGQ